MWTMVEDREEYDEKRVSQIESWPTFDPAVRSPHNSRGKGLAPGHQPRFLFATDEL